MHQFHFISGLPRSGSTLLAAILRQNPRFHAGMTSPVGMLVGSMLEQFSAGNEFSRVLTQAHRRNLLRGVFTSYYADQVGHDVVFDTNRGWTARLPLLQDLHPQSKVLACVRDVPWVIDSLERRFRADPYENTRLFADANERATVESRVEALLQRNRLVGFAWSALREACYGEFADRILIIDYDLLCMAPQQVITLVYEFLGEQPFAHDFNQLSFDAPAFDTELGVAGLHTVRPRIEPQRRASVLPPDLFERCAGLDFWRRLGDSAAKVIASTPGASASKPT